jgi:diguanylate cyclase (GGDEF)-like protein
MQDSFGSIVALGEARIPRASMADPAAKTQRTRTPILVFAGLAAVVLCASSAAVAARNTPHAVGIVYFGFTLVMLGSAWAFLTRALPATGAMRIRWTMVAAASLAAAIGYAPSCPELLFNLPPERVFQTACFNASEALYLLAAVLFFAGVSRLILVVDAVQALLFILLRFKLVYSPVSSDHFTLNHLLIGQLMALFLFLIATVACLGAPSRVEKKFLGTLSWFFGLRMIAFFFSNQVSFTWLHHYYCSEWDVIGTTLLSAFCLFMLFTSPATVATAQPAAESTLKRWLAAGRRPADSQQAAISQAPSTLVSSLMPSFLTLINLSLALFLLRGSGTLAAVAIALSLICYVVRTALLQAQSLNDKAFLETLNEQLQTLAMRDPLTGIGNRRSLSDVYHRNQAASPEQGLSLLLMDIDQFKLANDTHGHLYGDRVLITLARTLESLALRIPGGHGVRMGGDEFALILPNIAHQAAFVMAEELRTCLRAHNFEIESKRVSLSIGIASLHAAGDLPLEQLVQRADQALYRAKQLGRDRVEMQPLWEPGVVDAAPATHLELQAAAS